MSLSGDFVEPVLVIIAAVLAVVFVFSLISTCASGSDNDYRMFQECLAAGGSWYDDSLGGGTVECRMAPK